MEITSPVSHVEILIRNWSFRKKVIVSKEIFTDPKRFFILKLWHHSAKKAGLSPDFDNDHVIGFVAVDLRPLVAGFPHISGWYNLMDFVGRCRGQIKLTILPISKMSKRLAWRRDSDVSSVRKGCDGQKKEYTVTAKYNSFPSHVVQHTEQLITSPLPFAESQHDGTFEVEAPRGNNTSPETSKLIDITEPTVRQVIEERCWQPPRISTPSEEDCTRSLLFSKLNSLGEMTSNMKKKLNRKSEFSDVIINDKTGSSSHSSVFGRADSQHETPSETTARYASLARREGF
jgi:hypothetical protein